MLNTLFFASFDLVGAFLKQANSWDQVHNPPTPPPRWTDVLLRFCAASVQKSKMSAMYSDDLK